VIAWNPRNALVSPEPLVRKTLDIRYVNVSGRGDEIKGITGSLHDDMALS
jgi:hypothetical protein